MLQNGIPNSPGKYRPLPAILAWILLLSGGNLTPLKAETAVIKSLEDVLAIALENNLELKKSLWELTKAKANQSSFWNWESSSLSLTGGTENNNEAQGEAPWEGPWGGSASLTIPVVDQIKLEGTIKQDTSGQAGVVFFPLAHSDEEKQGRLTLISRGIEVEKAIIEAENRALTAALGWVVASSKLILQAKRADLREAEYRDKKIRYEAGEVSLEEVRLALRDWSSAKSLEGTTRDAVIKAETELASALGTRDYSLTSLETKDIQGKLKELQESLSTAKASVGATPKTRQDYLQLKSLEEELRDTWIFNPTLQADFSFAWDQDGGWTIGGGASLGFSLDDIQGKRRKELEGDITLARTEADQNIRKAELALSQVQENLETTRLNREVAELSLEEAKTVLAEATFLHDRGDLSRLEWEEAQLEQEDAQLNFFKALADEYAAWLELKVYF